MKLNTLDEERERILTGSNILIIDHDALHETVLATLSDIADTTIFAINYNHPSHKFSDNILSELPFSQKLSNDKFLADEIPQFCPDLLLKEISTSPHSFYLSPNLTEADLIVHTPQESSIPESLITAPRTSLGNAFLRINNQPVTRFQLSKKIIYFSPRISTPISSTPRSSIQLELWNPEETIKKLGHSKLLVLFEFFFKLKLKIEFNPTEIKNLQQIGICSIEFPADFTLIDKCKILFIGLNASSIQNIAEFGFKTAIYTDISAIQKHSQKKTAIKRSIEIKPPESSSPLQASFIQQDPFIAEQKSSLDILNHIRDQILRKSWSVGIGWLKGGKAYRRLPEDPPIHLPQGIFNILTLIDNCLSEGAGHKKIYETLLNIEVEVREAIQRAQSSGFGSYFTRADDTIEFYQELRIKLQKEIAETTLTCSSSA
jgi:hypothetical protein